MIRALTTLLFLSIMAASATASPRILVVSRDDKALKSFDPSTYELQFSVALPGDPHEVVVSPDGRFAYSSDFEGRDNTVSIIDLEQQKRIAGIKMDPYYKPHGLALTKDGSKLYATCEASRVVVEIDVAAQKITRPLRLTVDAAHMLALSPDDHWLFVTSQWDNNVTVFNTETGEVRTMLATGKGPEGVTVSPDGKEAWVVNRVWQTLTVIDLATMKKVQSMSCEHNPMRDLFTPDGTILVVTSALSDEIALVDRAKREVVGRIKTGDFPVGMALTKDGSRLYVTNLNGGDVAVVDLPSRKVIHRFAVGGQPEGIAIVE
jgi:YVTN family beta-propeller protein